MRPALNLALEGVVLGLAGLGLVIFSSSMSSLFSLSSDLMYTPIIIIVSVNNTAHLFTSVYWILFLVYPAFDTKFAEYVQS